MLAGFLASRERKILGVEDTLDEVEIFGLKIELGDEDYGY